MWGGGFGFGGDMPNSFDQEYHCFPGAFADKPELEDGDKILLPSSALDTLARLHVEYPMLFELTTPDGQKTHCSVLEFTAGEGTCYIPYWMMSNLRLGEGQIIRVRNVSLPKATFVKFQPQHVDFLDIHNPRAVLEYKLRSFSCVTIGDQLCISYNDKKYYLEVREVQPQDAACIIEADVNVDFEAPVGYKEPQRAPAQPVKPVLPEVQKAKADGDADNEPQFKAFSGTAKRLDGKQLRANQMSPEGGAAASSSSASSSSAAAASDGSQSAPSSASSSGHDWGSAAGTIKSDRRAAALAAANKRMEKGGTSAEANGSGALGAGSRAGVSPPKSTKWSRTGHKIARFQSGAGNRCVIPAGPSSLGTRTW